jgi:hypothetical protein
VLINFGMHAEAWGKAMCKKSVIDLVDFDKKDKKQRKALEEHRQRLALRQAEIKEALEAVTKKLGA